MLNLPNLPESGLHALVSWVTDLQVQREKHGGYVRFWYLATITSEENRLRTPDPPSFAAFDRNRRGRRPTLLATL
jgi:hypothetical protein